MMRSLVSKIISFFTDLNKNTKSFVLVTTDSLFLFFSWILFFPMPAIIMTEFKYSFTYYLIQSYTWGFIIPLFLYLVSMNDLRGFREVIRNFNLDNIYTVACSMLVFIFSMYAINVLIKKPPILYCFSSIIFVWCNRFCINYFCQNFIYF